MKCHRLGQVAPFPLTTYSEVVRRASTITSVVQSHFMPPWKPEPGWVPYRDERRLTPEQIALIVKWVADGMPEGDPSMMPQMPQFADGWQLGTPDLVLEMPAGFNVPADGPDIYRNFVLPTKLTEDKWVKAIELKPSARGVSTMYSFCGHHWRCSLERRKRRAAWIPGTRLRLHGPGGRSDHRADGWVGRLGTGNHAAFLPDGIAMPLPKASDLLLQTHFHPNGLAQTEKSVVGIYFGAKPTRDITQLQVPAFFGIRANIDIPAGTKDYKVRGSFTLPADADGVGDFGTRALPGARGEADRHASFRRGQDPALDPRLGF